MGAQDILVQRILRHAKLHVIRECYIKVFDDTVINAMAKFQARIQELEQSDQYNYQLKLNFGVEFNQPGIMVTESQIRGSFSDLLGAAAKI